LDRVFVRTDNRALGKGHPKLLPNQHVIRRKELSEPG
jgi:hypothetical protein